MSAIELQPLLSVAEAATILRVSRATAYRLVREGELPAVWVGGSLRVRPDQLNTLLERPAHEERPA